MRHLSICLCCVFLPYYEQLEAIFDQTFNSPDVLFDLQLYLIKYLFPGQNFRMDALHLVQVLVVNVSLHHFSQCNKVSEWSRLQAVKCSLCSECMKSWALLLTGTFAVSWMRSVEEFQSKMLEKSSCSLKSIIMWMIPLLKHFLLSKVVNEQSGHH